MDPTEKPGSGQPPTPLRAGQEFSEGTERSADVFVSDRSRSGPVEEVEELSLASSEQTSFEFLDPKELPLADLVHLIGHAVVDPSPDERVSLAQECETALGPLMEFTLARIRNLNARMAASNEQLQHGNEELVEFEALSEAVSNVSRANERLAQTGQTLRSFNAWLAERSAKLGG